MSLYAKLTLPNGLRVLLVPQADAIATTVLVLVTAGSKYETKRINGLSHFLEHMCFKGTTKRPKAIQISSMLDGLGAEYNAFTSQEWTGYYAKVRAEKSYEALELISDLYVNPIFDAAEMEKEKGVVIEEINMYEDLPPRRVSELFTQLLYGDQPAGWDIAGKKEIIERLTREELITYRNAHYVAKGTIIVIAGAFNKAKALAEIKTHFKNISREKKSDKLKTKEHQTKPELLVQFKKSDQTHFVVGCRAFDAHDTRRYALEVLSDLLGGGMSSRLFERVRNELGAAYYVKSSVDLSSDHGFLSVAAGVHHEKLFTVVEAVLKELQSLATTLVTPGELMRTKDHLAGHLLLGLETTDALATYYGGQEVLGDRIQTPKDLTARIQKVTAEEVREVARFFVRNEKLNCALIGPVKNEASLKKILKF